MHERKSLHDGVKIWIYQNDSYNFQSLTKDGAISQPIVTVTHLLS